MTGEFVETAKICKLIKKVLLQRNIGSIHVYEIVQTGLLYKGSILGST